MVGLNKVVGLFLGLGLCSLLIIVLTTLVEAHPARPEHTRYVAYRVINWTNRTALEKLTNASGGDTLIQVRNAMGSAVDIFCKSEFHFFEGDQRMYPTILKHLEEFAFYFYPGLWGNGLFWCDVSWKGKNLTIQAYDQESRQSNNTFYLFPFGAVGNLKQFDFWH